MAHSDEQKRLEIIQNIFKAQLSEKTPMRLVSSTEDADDCAVYDLPGTLSLVVGTDFVRGTKFTLFQEGYLDYFDVGYYQVVANLSDIAAMGATPTGLTTVIRYPDTLEDAAFIQIVEGIKEAASVYKTPIVGGDIGSYQRKKGGFRLIARRRKIAHQFLAASSRPYFRRDRPCNTRCSTCMSGYIGWRKSYH
jgi:thiamine-monophosphate kinase